MQSGPGDRIVPTEQDGAFTNVRAPHHVDAPEKICLRGMPDQCDVAEIAHLHQAEIDADVAVVQTVVGERFADGVWGALVLAETGAVQRDAEHSDSGGVAAFLRAAGKPVRSARPV